MENKQATAEPFLWTYFTGEGEMKFPPHYLSPTTPELGNRADVSQHGLIYLLQKQTNPNLIG